MKPAIVFTVMRKEILEMLRDRRTLISMVLVPILAIPALLGVANFFTSSGQKQAAQEAVNVAVEERIAMPGLEQALRSAGFKLAPSSDPRSLVERKKAAAAVIAAEPGKVRIYVDASRQGSVVSAEKLRAALDGLKTQMIRESLAGSGIPLNVLEPFKVERVDIAPKGKMAKTLIGGMIGYIVILLMFSGCMYPAIDMTAGEKERRTLEILLCSPAGRNEIVLGKILACSSAAFVTALLNIMSLTYAFQSNLMGPEVRKLLEGVRLNAGAVLLVLLAVTPTAITAAAVMITISLFAKSFKEGQSYLTPLIMLVVFPAMIGMLPGVDANPRLMMLPVFNVSQLIKSIFNGDYTASSFLLPFASNLVYAGVAFYLAVRIFKREDVLFRS